ncbi:MAG: hypothetical protein UU47_C0001G0092 [candidate division TM6 bacterium GW2011_GWE2_41_16]|nr:MAG: hypothetical protein UU47_C0001G0092 [candidate division TM6 bacterium GW2011_GWE2_41_16]
MKIWVKMFLTAVCLSSGLVQAMVQLEHSPICAPTHLGEIGLVHHAKGFHVMQNGVAHEIQNCYVEPMLCERTPFQLIGFLKNGYIFVNQLSDGQFVLRGHCRGLGGGVGGATAGCLIGKFAVHFVGHGLIFIASSMTGPAAPATAAALEATFLPFIEAASNVAAIAVGIAGGVATGPV